ncbi:hypothetical protein [Flexivirga sp.]|uniref:hypothetical protein n=1 Tax=Flexivirga sp. TaxID=1962927 RepID=UPI002D7E24ED|nr:hypothetical protein [Flexivirga sp.]
MLEDRVGQLRSLVIGVEEVLEPLELVQDDQVRLQVLHGGSRHEATQRADQAIALGANFWSRFASQIVEPCSASFQFVAERATLWAGRSVDRLSERLAQLVVQGRWVEPAQLLLETLSPRPAFEELPPSGAPSC